MSKQVQGHVIETRGDYWLVDFSKTLKRNSNFTLKPEVLIINSNKCLEFKNEKRN